MRSPPVGADESVCKGCGKRIWWINTGTARIPLDPVPPTYTHDGDGGWYRATEVWVSHFATCSKASDFSGRSKEPKP